VCQSFGLSWCVSPLFKKHWFIKLLKGCVDGLAIIRRDSGRKIATAKAGISVACQHFDLPNW